MKKITARERKNLNAAIYPHTRGLADHIRIGEIREELRARGFVVLQEDRTELACILCGGDGYTNLEIARVDDEDSEGFYSPIMNSRLVLSWYRQSAQPERYETTAYLS